MELIEKYDLTQIKRLDELYSTAGSNTKNDPSSVFGVTCDSYLNNNLLYIPYESEVLVFDVSNKIKLTKKYKVQQPWKICVTDDYMYVVPFGGGVINRYPLDK